MYDEIMKSLDEVKSLVEAERKLDHDNFSAIYDHDGTKMSEIAFETGKIRSNIDVKLNTIIRLMEYLK